MRGECDYRAGVDALRVESVSAGSSRARRFLIAASVAVGLLVLGALWYANRPPRPHLTLPSGMSLASVHGHCVEGSELFMCAPAGGPRSTLTVRVGPDGTNAYERLRQHLLAHGWVEYSNMLCDAINRDGCILPRASRRDDRLVLDWMTWVNPCDYAGCPARP